MFTSVPNQVIPPSFSFYQLRQWTAVLLKHFTGNQTLPSAFCSTSLSGINSGEESIPGGHHGENHKKGLRGHSTCGLERARMRFLWQWTWKGNKQNQGKRWEFRTGVGCLGPSYGQRSWAEELSCCIKNVIWKGNQLLLMGEITPVNSSGSWA